MKLNEVVKKHWDKFLMEKKNGDYSYGCVMLDVKISKDKWAEIQALVSDEDIFEGNQYGREDEPHITLLYGIHNDVPDNDVADICEDFEPVTVEVKKVGLFKTDEYDVVKFDIDSKELNGFNDKLKELPYTNGYPDYKAHMTICYVKPGKGDSIKKTINESIEDMEFSCSEITYSTAYDGKMKIQLK